MRTRRYACRILLFAGLLMPAVASHAQDHLYSATGSRCLKPFAASGSAATKSFRFIDLRLRDQSQDAFCYNNLVGNYTRLILVRDDRDSGIPMRRRAQIDRLVSEKQAARLVVGRLVLSKPNLSFTTSLADLTWVSGRKGQVSTSNIQLDTFATPLFRVDPETVIRVEFEVVSSAGTNVTLASDALSIIGQFAKPAAGGGLINAENLPQLQRTATALDSAISKFFKEQVSEKKTIEVTPTKLAAHPLKASVKLPFEWKVLGTFEDREFGSWTIYVEEARTSVFPANTLKMDTKTNDKFGPYSPQAAQINGFQLTPSKTLIEHLSGSQQVSAILSDLQTAVANNASEHRKESAQLLYAILVAEAQRLGFNMTDSVAIAMAFSQSGRIRGRAQEVLQELSEVAQPALNQLDANIR